MNIQQKLYLKHQTCECYVERHYVQKKGKTRSLNNALVAQGQLSPKPALMCRTHGRWLKWLSESEAQAIEGITQ